jgi:hypothetical protein
MPLNFGDQCGSESLNRLAPERIQPIMDLANRPVVFLDADAIKYRVSQVLPELKDIRVSRLLPPQFRSLSANVNPLLPGNTMTQ